MYTHKRQFRLFRLKPSIVLTNSGANDTFVVKYNTSGTAQWATRIGGTSSDIGFGISTDSDGNIYVTGQYPSSTLTIYSSDGSTFGTLANSDGSNDTFVVKYNTSGIAQWATRIAGTTGTDVGYGISTDSTGNIFVTGSYASSTLTIYSSDTATFGTLANAGNYDTFVVKYNTSGIAQWSTRIAGTSGDFGRGISTDSDGNVYVTGYYQSTTLTVY